MLAQGKIEFWVDDIKPGNGHVTYTLNVILRTPSIIVLVGFLSAFHTLVTREGITVEEWPLLAGL